MMMLLKLFMLQIIIVLSSFADIETGKQLCEQNDVWELYSNHPGRHYSFRKTMLTNNPEEDWSYFPVVPGIQCFTISVTTTGNLHFALAEQYGPLNITKNIITIKINDIPFKATIYDNEKKVDVIEVDTLDNSKKETIDYLKASEWPGFWFSWANNVVQVGREDTFAPFMKHKFSNLNEFKLVGIKSDATDAEFYIGMPKCPPIDTIGCRTYKNKSSEIEILLATQKENLNQIKFDFNQFKNFKGDISNNLKTSLYENIINYYKRTIAIHTVITEKRDYVFSNALHFLATDFPYLDSESYNEINEVSPQFLNDLGFESNILQEIKANVTEYKKHEIESTPSNYSLFRRF